MFCFTRYSELLKASFGRTYLVLFIVMVCSTSINLFNVSNAISHKILFSNIFHSHRRKYTKQFNFFKNLTCYFLQFSQIMMTKKLLDMSKYILFIFLYIVYLTMANYAGQKFIDCDTYVYRTM